MSIRVLQCQPRIWLSQPTAATSENLTAVAAPLLTSLGTLCLLMLTGGVCWLACAAYLVKKLSSTNNVSQLIKSWNSDITPLASCNSLKILKQFLSGLIWKIFGWGGVRQYLTLYLKIIKVKIMPHAPHVHTHVSMCVMMCVYSRILILIIFYTCVYDLYIIYTYLDCVYIL